MFRVVGKIVEQFAKKLEGCWCHEDLLLQNKGRKRKSREIPDVAVAHKCVWKGRRGPWLAAVGLPELFHNLTNSTSDRLQLLLDQLSEKQRGSMVSQQEQLRSSMVEILQEKMYSGR